MHKRFTKIFLLAFGILFCLLLSVPGYILLKNIQNDMPLREYVKETILPRLKTDLKRYFTFSENTQFNIPELHLEINPAELIKLEAMRVKRMSDIENEATIYMGQDHWDFVSAVIKHQNEEHQVKIRIRGDMPSNYNRGLEKASFRFNIESNSALFGKKKLSLVRCFLENNFYGYLFSHFLDKEGVVSNDVMFVRLFFNGEDSGICFLQEGFSKELTESSGFREGVLLRFKNDCIDNNGVYNTTGIPELVAYRTGKTMKDSALSRAFSRAQTKFDHLNNYNITVSQCFDINKFSKFMALSDIFLAHHSYVCHNAKLYFNPINDKFEPVAWDPSNFIRYRINLPVQPGYTSYSGEIYSNAKSYPLHNLLWNDTIFLKSFNHHLHEFSGNGLVSEFINQHQEIISHLDPILYRQRFQQQFHPEWMTENIKAIHNWFTTDTRLNAKIFRNDEKLVVNSTLPVAIYLTKLKLDSGNVIALNKVLLPFQSDTISISRIHIRQGDTKFTLVSTIYGFEEEQKYKGNIFEKMDQYNTPDFTEITDSTLLAFDTKKRTLCFKSEKVVLKKNLFIPSGYKLVLKPGANILLTNNSNIISESALEAKGTPDNNIFIKSDGTGGILIKNSTFPSVLEYVEFEHLGNPQSGNWSLTGAVNFYETEVQILNCIFKNNISEDALNIIRSKFTIDNSFVSHTYADAIDIDFSSGKIINTVIENTKNDALDFSGSHIEAKNITLRNIGDKAVSGGENTYADIQNITIKDSFIGISAKDKSIVKSKNITIENTTYSMASYQKKVEFGPAIILVNNYKNGGPKNDFLIEKNSLLVLDGDSMKGEAINVFAFLYNGQQ